MLQLQSAIAIAFTITHTTTTTTIATTVAVLVFKLMLWDNVIEFFPILQIHRLPERHTSFTMMRYQLSVY